MFGPQQLGLVRISQFWYHRGYSLLFRYIAILTCIMSDTLKCAVISCTQRWAGVPGAHCGTSYSPALASVWSVEVRVATATLSLPHLIVHPQQVLVGRRRGGRGGGVGLVVEPADSDLM